MARKRTISNSGMQGNLESVRTSVRKARPRTKPTAVDSGPIISEPKNDEAKPAPAPVIEAFNPEAERREIERLAYSYWLARGCQGGSPEDDWFRAEQEVRARALK